MRHLSVENIMTYVDGYTLAAEKPQVEQHLHTCPDCSELRQDLHNLVTHLQQDTAGSRLHYRLEQLDTPLD